MNLAKIIEIDGKPALLIYPKTGEGPHTDIEGFTNRETGRCTTVRFEGEGMPEPGTDTFLWLNRKVQEVLDARIESHPWSIGSLVIQRVYQTTSSPQPAAAVA